jgi:hypothetical protein
MCSPQSDDQPWHADLGSYQIDREPKGQEHAFISLGTNAKGHDTRATGLVHAVHRRPSRRTVYCQVDSTASCITSGLDADIAARADRRVSGWAGSSTAQALPRWQCHQTQYRW